MTAGRGLVPTDNDAARPGGAAMHLFRMSAISRRDGSSLPIGSPTGPGSRAARLVIRLDDRRHHKPMSAPPALFGTLGASLERYNHLGITARRGRVHHGGYSFKVQSDT